MNIRIVFGDYRTDYEIVELSTPDEKATVQDLFTQTYERTDFEREYARATVYNERDEVLATARRLLSDWIFERTKEPGELSVGQKVYIRTHHVRDPQHLNEATITKVGRKWVTLSTSDRFDKETFAIDGGEYSSPGQVYLTREAYFEKVATGKALRALCDALQTKQTKDVSLNKIRAAAQILGISLPNN